MSQKLHCASNILYGVYLQTGYIPPHHPVVESSGPFLAGGEIINLPLFQCVRKCAVGSFGSMENGQASIHMHVYSAGYWSAKHSVPNGTNLCR